MKYEVMYTTLPVMQSKETEYSSGHIFGGGVGGGGGGGKGVPLN